MQLSDEPLNAVHFVEGEDLLVCAWLSDNRADFFRVQDGTHMGNLRVPAVNLPGVGSGRRELLDEMSAPTGAVLPRIRVGSDWVFNSYDGRLRLIHRMVDSVLELESDGICTILPVNGGKIEAVAFDRELGTSLVITDNGIVHIFQQHIPVGSLYLDKTISGGRLIPLLADAGALAVVVGWDEIVRLDLGGGITARINLHNSFASCSPDGGYVVTVGASRQTIHVLNDGLDVLFQGGSQDLWHSCDNLQPVEIPDQSSSLITGADITHDAIIACGVGGHLCVLTVEDLERLPQTRSLF